MKYCPGCDTWKDESEFNWKNRLLGKLQSHCKVCQSTWTKRHYQKNKGSYLERAKSRNARVRLELQEFVFEYLKTHPCVDCGNNDPLVLSFDHIEGSKRKEISLLLKNAISLDKLIQEIDKCEVRCANCHTRRHALERGFWKTKYIGE